MKAYTRELDSCLTNEELELILMPTEGCNFRCTYCYEEWADGRMRPEVVQGIKSLVRRRVDGLRRLSIAWFGGEPLLAQDLIDDILSDAKEALLEHPRVRFESSMTTNAYLLDPGRFDHLLKLGVVKYQISLDGPRSYHDAKRLRADGRGTFDRIWRNLLAMRDNMGRFLITVRMHVARDNHETLPGFIDEFKRSFGADPRFQLFFRTLTTLGGPNDRWLPVFGPGEGQRVVSSLNRLATDKGVRRIAAGDFATACYAARGNSLVVRPDGRINKCTVALDHPNNLVGRIKGDGSLRLEAAKMRMWLRGALDRNERAMQCPMKGYADRTIPTS